MQDATELWKSCLLNGPHDGLILNNAVNANSPDHKTVDSL